MTDETKAPDRIFAIPHHTGGKSGLWNALELVNSSAVEYARLAAMRENPAAFGVGRKVKELVWSNHTAWSSEALGIKGVVYYIERMAKSAEWILYLNGSGMGIRRSKGKKADVISAAQTHYERLIEEQFK